MSVCACVRACVYACASVCAYVRVCVCENVRVVIVLRHWFLSFQLYPRRKATFCYTLWLRRRWTRCALPITPFLVVVPHERSWAQTVLVCESIAACDVHVTAGARLVVAIRKAGTGSDALSAAGLSVACKNRDTPPNDLDKHKAYFINLRRKIALIRECRVQLNILL